MIFSVLLIGLTDGTIFKKFLLLCLSFGAPIFHSGFSSIHE